MIRMSTLLWLAVAAGLLGGLFQLKIEVSELESDLAALRRTEKQERAAVQVLRAEWSYLNRADRLARLAKARLPDLVPLEGAQLVRLGRLNDVLDRLTLGQRPQAPPGKRDGRSR